MSALSLVREYGSSEESDSECDENKLKSKLPPPNLNNVTTVSLENHVDDPLLHDGRLRSFPHLRGNWATFVYVKYPDNVISELIFNLRNLVVAIDESCLICENIHLSLSRTVVLKYHLINTFTSSLQAALSDIESFNFHFVSIEVYCNDEETRTFIALKVDHLSEQKFFNISKKVDKVLEEFKLPLFYKKPSYHSSILWVNGNKKSKLNESIDKFKNILSNEADRSPIAVLIDTVHCKVGNKHFQFCLK